jgi:MFS family permease
VAASLPGETAVEVSLIPVGALAVFFGSTANAHMQIWSEPHIRGRVMAIYTLLTLGTTVVGGPFVGWVCGRWSPRTGIALAGTVTGTVAMVILVMRVVRTRDAGSLDRDPLPSAPRAPIALD